MKKLFGKIKTFFAGYINDSSVSVKDRSFIIFSLFILLEINVSIVNGIYLHSSAASFIGMGVGEVLYILYVTYELKHNKVKRAKIISSLILMLAIMPLLFFMRGGIYAGAPIAMLVNGYFLVTILEGRLQRILCLINAMLVLACFIVSYVWPESVRELTRSQNYFCLISNFMLAVLEFTVMIAFQMRLIGRETAFAEEKAREAEELNRSQNRFFASMSHEIRTPINTVLGLNEIILRQEDASEEIRKDARNIQGAGRLLLALINDILDVSKIEAGKMDIVPVNYNVASMMSEIVNMIWLKADEKGLEFKVDIDPEVPEVLYGDEVRIKQILINLLNNAVKYTKEGSVTLHIECDFPETGVALLKINVIDTGMGIKSESLPHLFDSFQRVDEEKNRHIEGTGLGLSLVKQLVELMGGEITVNSIYTQGSTFSVAVRQGIASEKRVGDLSISNAGGRSDAEKFEHSFHAPEARILIVDDNEMNLAVEQKLLDGTEITVDLAASGAEALTMTLRYRYDVIFMDHLMPEMDGIECYGQIRSQMGGLNNNVPVIVLTANAGGENIDLYNQTGFDGYLVKPVSGKQLEDMLITHLPREKMILTGNSEITGSSMSTASGYARKRSVQIVASSMSDLPEDVRKELMIDLVPFRVITDKGVFYDNVDIDSEELVAYLGDEHRFVTSDTPSQDAYIKFLSEELKKAHNLIYITLSSGSSKEVEKLTEICKTFDNVYVVNSETLSSGTGILAMIAARLAQQNVPVEKILSELEEAKKRIRCSFVLKSTDIMARRGHISPFVNSILSSLWLRPVLREKNDKLGVGRFFMGTETKCYEKYIKKEFSAKSKQDKSFVFITYVGMKEEDLIWIQDMTKNLGGFEHIIFQKASAGIASNCGEGAFGFLYMEKGDKNYNLGALFRKLREEDERYEAELAALEEAEEAEEEEVTLMPPVVEEAQPEREKKWYDEIPNLDSSIAIKNSGSEDAFLSVLKIFYDSYPAKSDEIKGFFDSGDWENYTVKVHALKSSSRLVGAVSLGNDAEKLEMAGKGNDLDYIRANHDAVMEEYKAIRESLSAEFGPKEDPSLPEIDPDTLAELYGALEEFSYAKDLELSRMMISSAAEYRLPKEDAERFERLQTKVEQMDWEGIREILAEIK